MCHIPELGGEGWDVWHHGRLIALFSCVSNMLRAEEITSTYNRIRISLKQVEVNDLRIFGQICVNHCSS